MPPGTVTMGDDKTSRAAQEQQTRKLWLAASESFVRSLNKRFYAASLIREALAAARSLRRFGARGRVVPGATDATYRELYVGSYRPID